MRIDHIAYRVPDRYATAHFFVKAFGYKIADEFFIDFKDGSQAKCFALSPPEHLKANQIRRMLIPGRVFVPDEPAEYHLAPEIFVSDGSEDSVVGKWVKKRQEIGLNGGIHHVAYEVDDVEATMEKWISKGWATFTTPKAIKNSDDLEQCFTHTHPLTGVVYEFIKRGSNNKGFNINNVRDLMESTNG